MPYIPKRVPAVSSTRVKQLVKLPRALAALVEAG
jgi:hypothetical protein